jgi:hypothetical protein
MSFIKRFFRFVVFHLFKNPAYLFVYAATYFLPGFKIKINFYKHEDIVKLLEEGKSLIRFGDGEIHIMNYGPVHYQKFEKKIRDTFFETIRNYKEDSPYVLCLNELPITQTNRELRKRNLLHSLLPVKSYYQLYFPKNLKYFDQMFFYYNDTFSKYVESFLLDKKVVIITWTQTVTSLKHNPRMPLKDVVYIETPEQHAFSAYEAICHKLDEVVGQSPSDKTIVVLAAFGPASKVLAYEYSMKYKNVIVIDIGRGIEILYSEAKIDDHIFPEYAP